MPVKARTEKHPALKVGVPVGCAIGVIEGMYSLIAVYYPTDTRNIDGIIGYGFPALFFIALGCAGWFVARRTERLRAAASTGAVGGLCSCFVYLALVIPLYLANAHIILARAQAEANTTPLHFTAQQVRIILLLGNAGAAMFNVLFYSAAGVLGGLLGKRSHQQEADHSVLGSNITS